MTDANERGKKFLFNLLLLRRNHRNDKKCTNFVVRGPLNFLTALVIACCYCSSIRCHFSSNHMH